MAVVTGVMAWKTAQAANATRALAASTKEMADATKEMSSATKDAAAAAQKDADISMRSLAAMTEPIWFINPAEIIWSFQDGPGGSGELQGSQGTLLVAMNNVGQGHARTSLNPASVRLKSLFSEMSGIGNANHEWTFKDKTMTMTLRDILGPGQLVGGPIWNAAHNDSKPQSVLFRVTFSNASQSIWWTEWIDFFFQPDGIITLNRQLRSASCQTEQEAIDAEWPW
jgi:hypothetical protein